MRGAAAFVDRGRRTTHKCQLIGLLHHRNVDDTRLFAGRCQSQILVENRSRLWPQLRGPRRNVAITFGVEELEWRGYYPMVKKIEDMFICFDRIHKRDKQAYGQTPHDGIGRAYAKHRAAKISE